MALPEAVKSLLRADPHDVRVALVGASRASHKYGNIILRDLLSKGYVVYPVNPALNAVGDQACYPTVEEVPEPVQIVNFVVPPPVARAVVEGLSDGPGPILWFQPGAFDQSAVELAQARGHRVVAGPCIMVETAV